MLRIFDATEDIGTLSLALQHLGIDHRIKGVLESDAVTNQVHQHLHGKVKTYTDSEVELIPTFDLLGYRLSTRDLKGIQLEEENLIINKPTSHFCLTYSLIKKQKPRYLVMETTKQLIGKSNHEFFETWLSWLKMLGYQTSYQVLNTKDYNLPQDRERLFVISILNPKRDFEFPISQLRTQTFRSCLDEKVDDSYYLYQRFNWFPSQLLKKETVHPIGYFSSSTNPSKHSMSQTIYSLTGLCPALPANDYKRPIKVLLTPIIQVSQMNENRFKSESIPFQTKVVRKLTPKECFRLMGMTDEIYNKMNELELSNTKLYLLSGNSNILPIWEGILKNLLTKPMKP